MSQWLDFLGAEVRFVDTPSFGRVRIVEAGRNNSEALFLMHGIGGHLEAYAKTVVPLSGRFHVVAFDFVGHGLSEKRTDIDYLPVTYARQLAELMDAMGIEQAHVSGESLGGWVTGVFAAMYPARILRAVLNTSAGIPVVSEKGRRDLRELADLSKKNFGQVPTVETVRKRMQWLMHESNWHLLDEEIIGVRLNFYQRPEFQKAAPYVFNLIAHSDGETAIEKLIDLEKIQCETLFLWTKFNPIHDVEAAQSACARVKNGALYVMKHDAAHWPQYEAPEEFNDVVGCFLETGRI
nr:meta-cleavage product hydrolase [Paraburkholderia sp.]